MTIGEVIIKYRNDHKLSQREFAKQCDLTNGTISFIESGINPKTQKPIVPTLDTINKLAKGMSISTDALIETADDIPISLTSEKHENTAPLPLPTDENELLTDYRTLNALGKAEARKRVNELMQIKQYRSDSTGVSDGTNTDSDDEYETVQLIARNPDSKPIELKKKKGKSIHDLPDYHGGRR